MPSGHKNNNKFKQLYEEFSTPNRYRTASGSPGKDYYQQKVDYTMDIILDDENENFMVTKILIIKIIHQMNYLIYGFN